MVTQINSRRHDLDWLRVLAILSVFFFHNMRFFDFNDWHVKNLVGSELVQTIVDVMCTWMMPLIFVISGASLVYAINKGVGARFFTDKVKRLVIPLVFGVFTIAPIMVYLERYTHHDTSASFFAWLPHYFDGVYGFGGNFAFMGLHLWYLLVLILFTLVFLPLFLLLVTRAGKAFISSLAEIASYPGVILLFALLIALPLWLLDPSKPWNTTQMGGWSLWGYMPFFVLGFILFSDDRYQTAIIRHRWVALIAALAILITATALGIDTDGRFGTTQFYLGKLIIAVFSWLTIVAMLGFGMKHLTFENRFLKYANEAVLPFYWLHQFIILVIGYFIVQLSLPVLPKYLIIASLSFLTILVLYEYVIRRVNVLRFLLGIKPLKKAAPAVTAAPSPAHAD